MADIITAALAGALAEVATAATVSTMATGIIGNRADALVVRSLRFVSGGFRRLSGASNDSSADTIIQAVHGAFSRSILSYVETLSSQSTNLRDRLFVQSLQISAEAELTALRTDVTVHLADSVRPLLASMAISKSTIDCNPLSKTLVEWFEKIAGPMPSHFQTLLIKEAPDGSPSWINRYRNELSREIIANSAFEKLLIVSQISDIATSNDLLERSAKYLQLSINSVDERLTQVDSKVDQLIVLQSSQSLQIQKIGGLLHQLDARASPDISYRILANAMLGPDGRLARVALIYVNAFDAHRMVQDLSREDRLTLFREVQARLWRLIGDSAYVGRFDGGDFDVIIRDVNEISDVKMWCQDILSAFHSPFQISGNTVTLTPKIGFAIAPDHGFSPEAVQRNADLALRTALDSGGNEVVAFSPELHSDVEDRRQMECDLRHALKNNGLQLAFQPVVSLKDKRIVGYETLIRWHHVKYGQVSPARFIPLAEDTGMIGDIGEWVLRNACRMATSWKSDLFVAVNISPIQFVNPDLPLLLSSIIYETGLSPNRLDLEIAESVFLYDGEKTDDIFHELKLMGLRMTLDDFGTGYSSLGYLRHAPFDRIKIDQSFVRGASSVGSRNAAIIEAIATLAKSLNMDITAEGIETELELRLVENIGCTHGQGYYFGRPLTSDKIDTASL